MGSRRDKVYAVRLSREQHRAVLQIIDEKKAAGVGYYQGASRTGVVQELVEEALVARRAR